MNRYQQLPERYAHYIQGTFVVFFILPSFPELVQVRMSLQRIIFGTAAAVFFSRPAALLVTNIEIAGMG